MNPTPSPSHIKGLSFSSPRCGGIEGGARSGVNPLKILWGGHLARLLPLYNSCGVGILPASYPDIIQLLWGGHLARLCRAENTEE